MTNTASLGSQALPRLSTTGVTEADPEEACWLSCCRGGSAGHEGCLFQHQWDEAADGETGGPGTAAVSHWRLGGENKDRVTAEWGLSESVTIVITLGNIWGRRRKWRTFPFVSFRFVIFLFKTFNTHFSLKDIDSGVTNITARWAAIYTVLEGHASLVSSHHGHNWMAMRHGREGGRGAHGQTSETVIAADSRRDL